jgi:hypothetical protein
VWSSAASFLLSFLPIKERKKERRRSEKTQPTEKKTGGRPVRPTIVTGWQSMQMALRLRVTESAGLSERNEIAMRPVVLSSLLLHS